MTDVLYLQAYSIFSFLFYNTGKLAHDSFMPATVLAVSICFFTRWCCKRGRVIMDKKLIDRLLGIATIGLLLAGILFLGLQLFRENENHINLIAKSGEAKEAEWKKIHH